MSNDPKIREIRPHWNFGYANRPEFYALVSRCPKMDEFIHEDDGQGHYRGHVGPIVHYMYSDGKPTHGFGGREIKLQHIDGKVRTFIGGWSSNARQINASWPDDPCVEVAIRDNKKEWLERGGGGWASNLTYQSILDWWIAQAVAPDFDWGIALMWDSSGPWIEPTMGRGQYVKHTHMDDKAMIVELFTPSKYLDAASVNRQFWDYYRRLPHPRSGGELGGDQMRVVNA